MKRRRTAATALVALAVIGAACGGGDKKHSALPRSVPRHVTTSSSTSTSSSLPDASTTSTAAGSPTTAKKPGSTTTGGSSPGSTSPGVVDAVAATKVATLKQPTALAVRPGEPNAVYIAQKGGIVRRLVLNGSSVTVDPTDVMDINNRLAVGDEQGLLGIAFAPNGASLFADYTDTNGDIRVVELPFRNGRANTAAPRVVLAVDHPYANHNGGNLVFGPDKQLYITIGDGGGGGDPLGSGQNVNTLLGKVLRINPFATNSAPYSVPADNPFVGQAGARPEVWHYGLRNPWRMSFDRATGEQWIGDVGQDAYEEIDHVAAGRKGVNFGWNKREAKHPYSGGATPSGAVDPELELTHADGNCSVTGGYVYRGSTIRGLGGTYVFADYCRARLLGASGGTMRELGPKLSAVSSFGEDASGELWVMSLEGPVYRLERAT